MPAKKTVPTFYLTEEGRFLLRGVVSALDAESASEAVRIMLDRESGKNHPYLRESAKRSKKQRVSMSIDTKHVQILDLLASRRGLSMADALETLIRENAIRLEVHKQLWSKRVRRVPMGMPGPAANERTDLVARIGEVRLKELMDGVAASRRGR